MSDPGTLELVKAAVGENTSLKKMTIQAIIRYKQTVVTWTNVAVAILKGAAKNETLGTLYLGIPDELLPAQELVDEVRRLNPKLQLAVLAGRGE